MNYIESQYIPYHAEHRVGRGTLLIFAPHPDDEVLGCGGAIMRHVEEGDPVRVVIVTDGAWGAGDDMGAYALTRQAESRCAAAVLGYGEPVFWGLPDRGLSEDEPLICRILNEISSHSPDLVFAPSGWEIHPDHQALSRSVMEAVRRHNRPLRLVWYEVGMPLFPNLLLDITGLVERKQAAMNCFASQLARQLYDRHVMALNKYRTYTLPNTVEAAEAYRIINNPSVTNPFGEMSLKRWVG